MITGHTVLSNNSPLGSNVLGSKTYCRWFESFQ